MTMAPNEGDGFAGRILGFTVLLPNMVLVLWAALDSRLTTGRR